MTIESRQSKSVKKSFLPLDFSSGPDSDGGGNGVKKPGFS